MFKIKKKRSPQLTEKEVGKTLYAFETLECVNHHRGKTWFFGLGIGVLIGTVFGIMQDSISLVFLSVLLGGIYTITHSQKSPQIKVIFTELGMVWRNTFFLYSNINSFWIFWKPGETKVLHINKSEGFPKEIVIPIATADPEMIKKVLGYYVPEREGKKEKVSDVISRTFKL